MSTPAVSAGNALAAVAAITAAAAPVPTQAANGASAKPNPLLKDHLDKLFEEVVASVAGITCPAQYAEFEELSKIALVIQGVKNVYQTSLTCSLDKLDAPLRGTISKMEGWVRSLQGGDSAAVQASAQEALALWNSLHFPPNQPRINKLSPSCTDGAQKVCLRLDGAFPHVSSEGSSHTLTFGNVVYSPKLITDQMLEFHVPLAVMIANKKGSSDSHIAGVVGTFNASWVKPGYVWNGQQSYNTQVLFVVPLTPGIVQVEYTASKVERTTFTSKPFKFCGDNFKPQNWVEMEQIARPGQGCAIVSKPVIVNITDAHGKHSEAVSQVGNTAVVKVGLAAYNDKDMGRVTLCVQFDQTQQKLTSRTVSVILKWGNLHALDTQLQSGEKISRVTLTQLVGGSSAVFTGTTSTPYFQVVCEGGEWRLIAHALDSIPLTGAAKATASAAAPAETATAAAGTDSKDHKTSEAVDTKKKG